MLKNRSAIPLTLVFSAFMWGQAAFAQTTTPKDVIKEPSAMTDLDIKGAVKVETAPAVQPEDLNKAAEALPEKLPQTVPSTPGVPHYFGVHAAAGLPHPVSFGLNYLHSSGMFSAELNTGSFNMKADDVSIGMNHMQVGLRWHPFMGAFFVGANVGQRSINGEKTETINTIPVTAKVEVKSNYVMPQLGWMWGAQNGGFFMALEFGFLSPSGVETTLTTNVNDPMVINDPEYRKLEEDVKKAGNDLGNIGLPSLSLLKLGWLF